jgi:hypothetical protein
LKQLVVSLVLTIIVLGIVFWSMNNPDGIGSGLDQGAKNVKNKIIEATQ